MKKLVIAIISVIALASCTSNNAAREEILNMVNHMATLTSEEIIRYQELGSTLSASDWAWVNEHATPVIPESADDLREDEVWSDETREEVYDACYAMELDLIRESVIEEFGSYEALYKYLSDNLYKSKLIVCDHEVDYCDAMFDFVDYTDARGTEVHLFDACPVELPEYDGNCDGGSTSGY